MSIRMSMTHIFRYEEKETFRIGKFANVKYFLSVRVKEKSQSVTVIQYTFLIIKDSL